MRYMIKAITNFLYPVVKFSYRQKHLHAIRVGFVNILPLVLIGAIVTLVNNLPLPFYQEFMSSILHQSGKLLEVIFGMEHLRFCQNIMPRTCYVVEQKLR